MRIDLHTHSTASDGQYSPSDLVSLASEKGLILLALTDHDTISGLNEAEEEAEKQHLRFIPGIEISCEDVCEIHILGYGIDADNKELVARCSELADERLRRAEKICKFLGEKGIPTPLIEVRNYAGDEIVARPHFAAWLMDKGYVVSRQEAFEKYLDTDEFHERVRRNKPDCAEAIRLIHNAGGKAVLAHPAQYKMTDDVLDGFICRLKETGLYGIECFYSRNTRAQTMAFLALADKYDLKISCGSDFHGEQVKPDISLGMELEENYLSRLVISC